MRGLWFDGEGGEDNVNIAIGDIVDVTQLMGVCVYCSAVIFKPGMSVASIHTTTLEHIRQCKDHPLRDAKKNKELS